jgi:hypothetical protein
MSDSSPSLTPLEQLSSCAGVGSFRRDASVVLVQLAFRVHRRDQRVSHVSPSRARLVALASAYRPSSSLFRAKQTWSDGAAQWAPRSAATSAGALS